jgi:hypothetical protein
MHSTFDTSDGYLGSGTLIKASVDLYGESNHTVEILEFCCDRDSLILREREIVNNTLLDDPNCLNLRPGGKGGFTIEQQRENNRRSQIVQEALRRTNPEWVKMKSKKTSNANKLAYAEGRRSPTLLPHEPGKFKHSEESKLKISKANSAKQQGKNNSQYNTCWIYHPSTYENKKISKNDLTLFLDNGWVKGRKIKHT